MRNEDIEHEWEKKPVKVDFQIKLGQYSPAFRSSCTEKRQSKIWYLNNNIHVYFGFIRSK